MRAIRPAFAALLLASGSIFFNTAALAGDRLLASGGFMQIEGTGGGGLVPWATIAGLGTRDQVGLSAFCTSLGPDDFRLDSCGVALGWWDRTEISYARQTFDLGTTMRGASIEQHVFGVKVKVLGDAIFDQDTWLPQIAVGAQFKQNEDYDFLPKLLGARDDKGIDVYVAASKVWLSGIAGRTTLVGVTLRATKANQMGILGFGGDRKDGYSLMPEASAAMFLTDHFIGGVEYRTKPDNLSAFKEDDFWDAFVAWVPWKNISLTVAHADLGNVADKVDQRGWYASLQAGF